MNRLLIIVVLFSSFLVNAQEKGSEGRDNHFSEFSPEQISVLQTKKMTLLLNLDKNQQQEIQKMNFQLAKERKEKEFKKPQTSDERFELANSRLDKKIEVQKKMRTLLNEDQFNKWERSIGKRKNRDRKNNKQRGKQRKSH